MLGIFDSGSGGLTVLTAIRAALPNVDVVYLGDFANMPYGEKSVEEIRDLTRAGFRTLQQHGATHIVSACNSVSVSVTDAILAEVGLPTAAFVDMVRPTVAGLSGAIPHHAHVLVCATSATVRSGMYAHMLHDVGIAQVSSVALQGLVDAIEQNDIRSGTQIIETHLKHIHTPPSHLLFGCTHYPLFADAFTVVAKQLHWHDVHFIDPAHYVAEDVRARAWDIPRNGITRYSIDGGSDAFHARVAHIFAHI
jgi:glutamate racemase